MDRLGIYWPLLYIFFILIVHSKSSENETFVPTKEWQDIREGEPIPRGLHVRINLQTGKKEAKLIDKANVEKNARQDLSVLPDSDNDSTSDSSADLNLRSHITKELEEVLKNIPSDSFNYSPDKEKELRGKFKSYSELKKIFQKMNMNIQTDSEIITGLIKQYKKRTRGSNKDIQYSEILEDLDYLVHQIDNALWFIQEGGLDLVLLPMIVNQSNTILRVKSLRILGSITQNNPKAQISVFERNFGSHLSGILITSSNTDELSTCLYAFSSLLRKFPHAQVQVLPKTGLNALISVLSRETDLKIKVKAMTFISDLLLENEDAQRMEPIDPEKQKQYKNVELDTWLKDLQFCDVVPDFITKSRNQLFVQYSNTDQLIQALQITQKICFESWSENAMLRHNLLTIKNRLQGSEEEYLGEIAERIEELIKVLYGHFRNKEEL